ncbi:uncharacterized protein LOC144158524 [Haemaphysalis longicornis]
MPTSSFMALSTDGARSSDSSRSQCTQAAITTGVIGTQCCLRFHKGASSQTEEDFSAVIQLMKLEGGRIGQKPWFVSFHCIPGEPKLRKAWLVAIKRDPQFNSTASVCSKHFMGDDFLKNFASGHRMLADTAMPLVFSFPKPK